MESEQDLRKRIQDLEERVERLEVDFGAGRKEEVGQQRKEISVREIMIRVKPITALDKTLLIGYFLEKHRGAASFGIQELREGFREAREPAPRNLNDMVNKNMQKGYIMECKSEKGQKRTWMLTNSGESYVSEKQKSHMEV